MLDTSLQAFPSSVNNELLETLEKIRNVENKKRSASPKQEYSPRRRADFLAPIQDRLKAEERSYSRSPIRRPYDEYDEDDYRRYDDDRVHHKRQKVQPDYYRERPPRRYEEEDEEDRYENGAPHSGDWGAAYADDEEFTFNEPPRTSQKPKSQKASVKKKMKSSQKEDRKSSAKRDEGKGSKYKSSQKKKDKSSKKKASRARDSDSSDESAGERSGKKSERGVHNLHDWINRRVTGYLIFQNSVHVEKGDEEDHLNSVTGKKWKALTKAEKEEYKSIALNARVDLKKEFDNVDIDDEEIKDLQEQIEKKLKKIKKEDDMD